MKSLLNKIRIRLIHLLASGECLIVNATITKEGIEANGATNHAGGTPLAKAEAEIARLRSMASARHGDYSRALEENAELKAKLAQANRSCEDGTKLFHQFRGEVCDAAYGTDWGSGKAWVEIIGQIRRLADQAERASKLSERLAAFEGAQRKTDLVIRALVTEAQAAAPVRIEYPVSEWEVCEDIAGDGSVKLMGRWAEDGSPYFMRVPNQLVASIQALQRLAKVAHEARRVFVVPKSAEPKSSERPECAEQEGESNG